MATVKNIKKDYCDDVYTELSGMRDRIMRMREDLARTNAGEAHFFELFDRHLGELADQLEWKLQILSHACPYDWKGSAGYEENRVSVGQVEKPITDFSGGYLGG
jgi:hypothetical protein